MAFAALIAVAVGACSSLTFATSDHSPHPHTQAPTNRDAATPSARRPNIVFILTDDLSRDLVPYMPRVRSLERRGMTFTHYFVSDSLCCPSRTSIFTGDFPHDSGVFTNVGYRGGITAFLDHRDEQRSFNVYLHRAGYTTAMMGKYINGYLDGPRRSPVPTTYVPPGWNQWDVAGGAYSEFDYTLNENGHLRYFGHRPHDYLTDVLARKGARFIGRASATGKPFFLELATFAPHFPYTPAPRDAHAFPGLTAPRPRSFDVLPTHPPRWLAGHRRFSRRQLAKINRVFRRRVRSVQAVDDMLGRVEAALRAHGQLSNTYIVFSSDNGLHTGEYRLMPGKLTAFDTDIHVPLVIAGPGIRRHGRTGAFAENIDLAKTFEQIAGTSAPCDGHSLVPLFGGGTPPGWRNAVLIEHQGPDLDFHRDPDAQRPDSGNPSSYEALRTSSFLYVEYADGEREFYDLRTDPFELHNIAASLSAQRQLQLHAELAALEHCHTGGSCWRAAHIPAGSLRAVKRR